MLTIVQGSDYANSCNHIWQSYYTDTESWAHMVHNSTTKVLTTKSVSNETPITIYSTSSYTLCDGHIRINGSSAISVSTSTDIATWTYTETITTVSMTIPEPICSIQDADCPPLLESFSSAWQDYVLSQSRWNEAHSQSASVTVTVPSPTSQPHCPHCKG
jgi:hypothetical protein